MSKKIVIIESDASLSERLRAELETKGFAVDETPDGKAAIELVRREKPDLVVLSVELAAGQSGYIVCGKLKKDDELKKIPIIIIGKDADGFEAHKRLKARAEDYLKKPFDPPALLEKIGALIGLPEPESDDLVLDEDESLGLDSLGEDEPLVEPEASEAESSDAELDMLDAAFDDIAEPAAAEEPVEAPPDDGLVEDAPELESEALEGLDDGDDAEAAIDSLGAEEDLALESLEDIAGSLEGGDEAKSALDSLEEDAPVAALEALGELEEDSALDKLGIDDKSELDEDVSFEALDPIDEPAGPAPEPKPARVPTQPPAAFAAVAAIDDAELQSLRSKVSELQSRVRELEDELTGKQNELEAVKSTSGGKDKEYFALKEQNTKKDKEIVRLKQDLNEKEQEVIELRERENKLEQQLSELTTESAKKDAQIKTLTQRNEAYAAERRKVEAALTSTKDEMRQLSAKLATAQGELDQAQDAMADLQRELDAARGEVTTTKGLLDAANSELDGVREELKTAQSEHEATRQELSTANDRVASLEEEAKGLRARI
ncbi:MAG: response regulator, partial [Myxococcales bacterium]